MQTFFCGGNFFGFFSGKFGQNSFAPSKICLLPHLCFHVSVFLATNACVSEDFI